jgi:hypothetical protein
VQKYRGVRQGSAELGGGSDGSLPLRQPYHQTVLHQWVSSEIVKPSLKV